MSYRIITCHLLNVIVFHFIFHKILSRPLPHHFDDDEAIIGGVLRFKRNVTSECQDLIFKCLSYNAKDRPTLEEILVHPWMGAKLDSSSTSIGVDIPSMDNSSSQISANGVAHHGGGRRSMQMMHFSSASVSGPESSTSSSSSSSPETPPGSLF